MKNLRFRPGTFIEIDDLSGGRRVALVARDGVTFVDSYDHQRVTPLALHPIFRPLPLGSMMEYAKVTGLLPCLEGVIDFLTEQHREPDGLTVMRMLRHLKGVVETEPTHEQLVNALASADAQLKSGFKLHAMAVAYCSAGAA